MTLIMNYPWQCISTLLLISSIYTAYLRYKVEMADIERRRKRIEERAREMAESAFDFGKWKNN